MAQSRKNLNHGNHWETIRDNDQYLVKDNRVLDKMTASLTILHPRQSTNGHSHPGQEEVYVFMSGHGRLVKGSDVYQDIPVQMGSVVMIRDGEFHRVYNTENSDLIFYAIFTGERENKEYESV